MIGVNKLEIRPGAGSVFVKRAVRVFKDALGMKVAGKFSLSGNSSSPFRLEDCRRGRCNIGSKIRDAVTERGVCCSGTRIRDNANAAARL